ncbi:MAG: hypothetical protein ACLUI0_12050 [Blautia massiliensis (ex Durand et al. 2017)]
MLPRISQQQMMKFPLPTVQNTPEEPVDDLTQSPDDPAPAETGAVDSSTDNTDPFSAGEEDDFSDSGGK